MRREELLRALRRLSVETGSLACLGCGYEHNCSIHGCAVIREAAEALEEPPNAPLTLEELRKMYGEPVWIVSTSGEYNPCWGLINGLDKRVYDANDGFCPFHEYGNTWLAYRRRPEEG